MFISGRGDVQNITQVMIGRAAQNRVRYIQFSEPNIFKASVLRITTMRTPYPYSE